MAQGYEGVIKTSTGDLLRAGTVDWANDPAFDGETETVRTDIPRPSKVRDNLVGKDFHRWNGDAWAVIAGVRTIPNVRSGSGAPESAVTGIVGDLWQRTDGGAGTTLYVKESGTGNTGWVGVGVAS